MKSTSARFKKLRLRRHASVVCALVCAGLAGLALAGGDILADWAIMPVDTYAQLLAGLGGMGGMGFFVVLRSKRD
ncbi:hypothetical protein [Roseateles sp.]|uniref:hypothetical protein n=1 Tax=Roseateles sp. TaxID=1971397 RepID=UPI00286B10D6|nr:hypothetical protein [Roseateles sp.]